ncbi:hypothetical protein BsWGS_10901 [Bradybaena similaris]
MILQVLLLLTLARGTICQEITLSPPTLISPCTSKSRGGKDQFVFNGTLGKDVPSLLAQGWEHYVAVRLFPPNRDTDFPHCLVYFNVTTCRTVQTAKCLCSYQSKQIYFMITYSLISRHSKGIFFLRWDHALNPAFVGSDKNYSLPEICDVQTAHLTLTIAGAVTTLPKTRSCSFSMTLGTSNLMQLCCSDMAMPCYTQISFRGTVVATNESPCVVYSPVSDGVTGTLELSYSVCTQTDYLIGNNCTIQTGVVTTVATTPTTATTGVVTTANADGVGIPEFTGTTTGMDIQVTGTTSDPSTQSKSNTFRIAFWAALLLILLVIVAALVVLYIIRGRGSEEAAAPGPEREPQQDNLSKEDEDAALSLQSEQAESKGSAASVSVVESEV